MEKNRRSFRKSNIAILILAVIIILCVIGILISLKHRHTYKSAGISGTSTAGAYRHLTVDGIDYEFNNLIKTVLYIGIDSEDVLTTNSVYGKAPRSDALILVIMDGYNKRLSLISLNRNTMADVQQYDLDGEPLAKANKQLAYAFAEGEGGDVSSENTVSTVSDLLGGIPIDYYMVMNRSSIPYFNDLAGSVTVTVPNDDLSSEYPEMTTGSSVTLNGASATDFVRYRDTETSFSNSGRMERQKAYIMAYIDQIKGQLIDDSDGLWQMMNDSGINDYMLTNITRNQYLTLANLFAKMDLETINYYIPDGENDNTETLERFFLDETALQQHLLDMFYLQD